MSHRRTRRTTAAALLSATALTPLLATDARAADATWTGLGADTAWATPENWLPTAPPGAADGSTTNTDTATFSGLPAVVDTAGAVTISIDPSRNIGSLLFDNTSTRFVLGNSTGNALTLTAGGALRVGPTLSLAGTATSVTMSVAAPIVVAGASYTFENRFAGSENIGITLNNITGVANGATTLTFTGVTNAGAATGTSQVLGPIADGSAGTVSIVKTGTGTWDFRTPDTNPATYSGETRVQQGILRLNGLGVSSRSHYVVSSGANLTMSIDGMTIGAVTMELGATVREANSSRITKVLANDRPAFTIDYSALANPAGATASNTTVALNNHFTFVGTTPDQGGLKLLLGPDAGQVDIGGTGVMINLGSQVRPIDVAKGSPFNTYDLRIRGPLQGTGGFTKLGAGTLRLDNANNPLAGNVELREGTLILNAPNSLTATPALALTGGELRLNGNGPTQTFATIALNAGSITNASTSSNPGTAARAAAFTSAPAAGVTATADATLADAAAPASLTKSGPGTLVLSRANTYSAGTTVNSGTLDVANAAALGAGPLTLAGGRATLRPGLTAPVVLPAASFTGGTLDIDNNDLLINYPDGGPSPLAAIAAAVASAAGPNLTWTGPGLTSALAATTAPGAPHTAVGYSEASLFTARTGQTTLGPVTLDASAVIARLTYVGDATLDGAVTDADVDALIANYNAANANWSSADFNHDTLVNDKDLDLLASTLGLSHPAITVTPAALARLAALTAVPEPTTATVLALAACGLATRRARRRR